MAPSALFEEQIPFNKTVRPALLSKSYLSLPQDWFVVVTDVKNSTKAIEDGRYRDINAIGGSTIAAVVNASKPRKIPFVFGGDGASFCVPPELIDKVKKALRGCQELAQDSSDLELRVGIVPTEKLQNPVLVSRYYRTENLLQYFFMGGGMEEADALIKKNDDFELDSQTEVDVDFSGFECRWNEIPSQKEVTFSLIVKSRYQSNVDILGQYRRLAQKVAEVLGDDYARAPLSADALSLSFNGEKLNIEASGHTFGQPCWRKFLKPWVIRLENMIGSFWMSFGISYKGYNWGNYKNDLIENSDYEKVDDAYRTVLSANKQQLQNLLQWLEKAYQKGQLFYGCHQTDSAIITCLVEQSGINHIHFVDSSKGGYAMAAKHLKQQIKESAVQVD